MTADHVEFGDYSKLDSDDDNGKQFQDLVIKFSNLRTLLEPGAGRLGVSEDNDVRHKIGSSSLLLIIVVYKLDVEISPCFISLQY